MALRRLRALHGLVLLLLTLTSTLFGHVAAAEATDVSMSSMRGMNHDSSMTVCGQLCSSVLLERQKPEQPSVVQDDDAPGTATISAAFNAPYVPHSTLAAAVFRTGPPQKVPIYIQIQLLRV
jgi:hypothetical protein